MGGSSSSINSLVFPIPEHNPENYDNSFSVYEGISYYETKRDSDKIIIFSHGNGSDIYQMRSYVDYLSSKLNIKVVCYDYPGYGFSENEPGEEACVNALKIMYRKYWRHQIILMGHSLGTGVTINCVIKHGMSPDSIILISPYKSIPRVVSDTQNFENLALLLGTPSFNIISNIEDIRCPIKIFHGTHDGVISLDHSKDIYEKIKHKKGNDFVIMDDTGHNDILFKIDPKLFL